MDQPSYPGNLNQDAFLYSYWETTLRKPMVVADAALRAVPFATPKDTLVLAGLVAEQAVEAALRLVAVFNALDDRTHPVAHSLLQPLPGLAEWHTFVQRAAESSPATTLHDLSVGEDALDAAELLRSQPDLTWLNNLIAAVTSDSAMVLAPVGDGRGEPTEFWLHGTDGGEPLTVVFTAGENDTASIADQTADLCEIARGLLGAYIEGRAAAAR